jgi:phage-related baseplate assembly protein
MENTSSFQKVIETVEALSPEEQTILVDIVQNRLRGQKRQELLQDIAEAERNYLSGNFKRGSVADLMAELDE